MLVIAGSDPSGGGGLELDLQVLGNLSVPGAAVATCLTLQNSRGLQALRALPVAEGLRRLDAVWTDLSVASIKVGMLPAPAWIRAVAQWLDGVRATVVLDPVLAPTRGIAVHRAAGVRAYRRWLLPRADLLTPNAREAAALLGWSVRRVVSNPVQAGEALGASGPGSVLLKGGHIVEDPERVVDRLSGTWGPRVYRGRRSRGPAPRGTGCALSTAIAAELVRGGPPDAAVGRAIRFVRAAVRAAGPVGHGRPHLGLPTRS